MSTTFTLVGTGSILSSSYFPPIELEPNANYGLGLIGFYGYNSIPNIVDGCNKLYYGSDKVLTIPSGAYEITEINNYIQEQLPSSKADEGDRNPSVTIRANNNTLKSEIYSTVPIDFTPADSIGSILGFSKRKLQPNVNHISDLSVNIIKVISIKIECNITGGAYCNYEKVHTLYEFDVNVEPGYRLTKEPTNVIYLPVVTNHIDNITLKIVDQDGDLVNFQQEKIVIRLELKKY